MLFEEKNVTFKNRRNKNSVHLHKLAVRATPRHWNLITCTNMEAPLSVRVRNKFECADHSVPCFSKTNTLVIVIYFVFVIFFQSQGFYLLVMSSTFHLLISNIFLWCGGNCAFYLTAFYNLRFVHCLSAIVFCFIL